MPFKAIEKYRYGLRTTVSKHLKCWQVRPIKVLSRILWSLLLYRKTSINPDPTACDPRSRRCDP